MPITATISESNTSATSQTSGTLNSGALSGLTVTGVALAGQSGTDVGNALSGFYGSLTINADGSYIYTLNNTDRDTNLLASGDRGTERFVVTYMLGGVLQTVNVQVTINGIDEPGQINTVIGTRMDVSGPVVVAEDTYIRSTAASGIWYEDQPDGGAGIRVDGSIVINRATQGQTTEDTVGVLSDLWINNGRIAMTFTGVATQYSPSVTGAYGTGGINNGVISIHQQMTSGWSSSMRAIGMQGGAANHGLIEVTSTLHAYGVWFVGNFLNTGMIYVSGGDVDDPLGVVGIRQGGNLVNTGTIHVVSTSPDHQTVAYYHFPGSTNIYANVLTIDNQGTIVADIAFYIAGGYNVATSLTNSGHIEGDLLIDSGVNVLANLAGGSWIGNLVLGPQNDIVDNAGTITGNIDLGAHGDLFRGRGDSTVSGIVSGGSGQDMLVGANGGDRLSGGDGNDRIEGGGGADTLTGGAGADVFAYRAFGDSTGGARDTITDFVSGTDRIDLSSLGASSVTLTPQGGGVTLLEAVTATGTLSVLITGSIAMSDIVNGPASATLDGTGASETIAALLSGSTLNGRAGDDTLVGSDGDDILDGGTGGDSMFGGAGDDIYYVDSGDDRVSEGADGGIDEIRTTVGYAMQANIENMTLLGSSALGVLGNALDNVLTGNSAPNSFNGGGGFDTIIGGGGGDYIQASTARIVYRAVSDSSGNNWDMINHFVHGQTILDFSAFEITGFTFADHSDSYFFYDGQHMGFPVYIRGWVDVTIHTTAGAMQVRVSRLTSAPLDVSDFLWDRPVGSVLLLNGSATNDTLTGTDGAEDIRGLGGNDVLHGGGGNDLIDGGEGVDIASYAGANGSVTVDLNLSSAQDTGAAGVDTLVAIEGLRGSEYSDVLIGTAGDNSLDGGAGADRLYGGAGNDTYQVDRLEDLVFEFAGGGIDTVRASGNYYLFDHIENLTMIDGGGRFGVGNALDNLIVGNGHNNLLLGGAGDDRIEALHGDDVVHGEDGNDIIRGGYGIDTIIGGTGHDQLEGNSGADALYGGDGDDILYADSTPVQGDTIGSGLHIHYPPEFVTDILNGGDGNDTLYVNSGLGDYDLMDGGSGDDSYYVDTPDDLTFEAANGGTDTVYATINGAGYYLYANVENLVLGGDTPFGVGNELNNRITGSASSNWLLGGAGNDVLNGRGGNDVLFGESGADIFVFERGTGGDVVGDFVAGTDRIDLSAYGFTSFAQVQAVLGEQDGTAFLTLGNGDMVVLNGVARAALSAGDFILGSAGDSKVPVMEHIDVDPRPDLIHDFVNPRLFVDVM